MADESSITALEFARFYQRTVVPLRRYLVRFTGGSHPEAQDLAHEAYARVYPTMLAREIGQPQAFLYTTARHLALDRLRHLSRSPFDSVPVDAGGVMAASSAPTVQAVVMAREELELLEHAIADLPPGCRRVYLLRTVERRSTGEISRMLGISCSTVEKHLIRAVRGLHEALYSSAERRKSELSLPSQAETVGREP